MTRQALGVALLCLLCAVAQAQKPFQYSVDLTAISDDRLQVEMQLPALKAKELVFRLPKMVPGIYGALNFGKNVISIDAYDKQGRTVPVEKLDQNSWKIRQTETVRTIRYTVNDDWEDFAEYEKLVYRSPGSSFLKDSLFLINHNSLFGYIEGYDRWPVELSFVQPEKFYAATSLKQGKSEGNQVHFSAPDYHHLVDNPVLFARPDTSEIDLDGVKVLVACYSSSGRAIAAEVAQHIAPLLRNQKAYLGGKLPVDRYTFIIYHHAGTDPRSSFGDGLEHAQSTVILSNLYLDAGALSRNVYGIASHEFFHTVMPLALHSEEIEYYNFNAPVMSKHLWLYEGMTEYFTIHMPVKQGVQNLSDFCKVIEEKTGTMLMLDSTLALTELSRNAVERQDQYMNVYARGALVNLCMDILLRERSGGRYGVQQMVADLLKLHGRRKPFKDDELFAKMVTVSGTPALRDFIRYYIEGGHMPPLKESLQKVGILLTDNYEVKPDPNATEAQLRLRAAWIGRS